MGKNVVNLAKARTDMQRRQLKQDGWVNITTKLGTARDKRTGGRFRRTWIDELMAEEIWLSGAMAAKIVEAPSRAMLHRGVGFNVSDLSPAGRTVDPASLQMDAFPVRQPRGADVRSAQPMPPPNQLPGAPPVLKPSKPRAQVDKETKEATEKKRIEEDLGHKFGELRAVQEFIKAGWYSRAYGGAAILLGVDDGEKDLTKPLNEKRLKSVDYLTVLRPRECYPRAWATNPKSPNFGNPTRYLVRRDAIAGASAGFEVHSSRIIRFQGVEVSRRQLAMNRGWGASIFSRIYDTLNDSESSWASSSALIQDFAQAVWKMKGLADLVGPGGEGDETIIARAKAAELSRAAGRALMIDSEEEFERKQTPISGLPELLQLQMKRISADASIPGAILFGDQPSGLNATGDAVVRAWYDELASERELNVAPEMRRVARLCLLASEGPTEGVEPARWGLKFPPLWMPTELEEAQKRKTQADADVAYVNAQVLTPEEVAVSRFGGGEWSGETTLDLHARHVSAEAQASQDPPAVLPSEGSGRLSDDGGPA